MPTLVPPKGVPTNEVWANVQSDYPEALIRIASLRADKEHHLLFAWVELYPFDIAAPASWTSGERPWSVPTKKKWSCAFSATRTSAADAIRWYSDAANGVVSLALAAPAPIHARNIELGAEPVLGRFALGVEAPFIFGWHDGPRTHRLVPLRKVARQVIELSKIDQARTWLADSLGFDVFAFDEWLGSVALVAPDPLCNALRIFPSEGGPDGRETLNVQIVPRRTKERSADLSTLTLHVAERRSGAWVSLEPLLATHSLATTLAYPQPTGEIGYALVCSERGLLRKIDPAPWIREFNLNLSMGVGRTAVEVPGGGRRKPPQRYEVSSRRNDSKIAVGERAADVAGGRLDYLVNRRKTRERLAAAPQYVFGLTDAASASAADIERSREEAQRIVTDLIRRARQRLIFVDPFFGPREMRLFALRNDNEKVVPRVLTGVPGLKVDVGETPGFQVQSGLVLASDLQRLKETIGAKTPIVRVMPGADNATIHDRYLVVDDDVWHCGPSFNELGMRLGLVVRLPNPLQVRRMIGRVWARSTPLHALAPQLAQDEADV